MTQITTLLAATEEAQGIAALGIDPLAILAQGTTFVLFFFILKKFAFSKIVTTLEQRRETIEGSLDKAQELNRKNQEAEERIAELLSTARKEAEEAVTKGRKESASIIAAAEGLAAAKAEKIVAEGRLQIEAEVIKARETLKKETLELVAMATSTLLEEKIDAKKNESLIKNALEGAER